jgi:serine phosphatase RsbU (regulator of sigma subunit)
VTTTVANLLALYAGLLLLNTGVAVLMYRASRGPLYRDLVLVWAGMLLAFAAQAVTSGVAPNVPLVIVAGFATLWLGDLAFARLVSDLFDVPVPWRASQLAFALGAALTVVAGTAGLPFVAVALPISLGIAFPLAVTATGAIRARWRTTTLTGRMLLVACIAITLHTLDFPFLRPLDSATALGFTIAILVVFALSIFAPAMVAEVTVGRQARLQAELEVAQRIQTKVVPAHPAIPGFEIACHMRPAEEVGGDYYDVYTLGDHSWILLGDVTGHGLSSGLVMLMAQSVLASILHTREEISPSELAFLANRILYQNLQRLEELRSMTLVALCRVGDSRRFVYSGKHDHVYVYRASTRNVESVEVAKLPHDLGFMDEFPRSAYGEGSFDVADGDLILVTTDGMPEAPNQGSYHLGMFDEARIKALLLEIADRPLAEIKQRLLDALEAFTGGTYHDDVTFLLARPTASGPGIAA